jgi:hypothetical protein
VVLEWCEQARDNVRIAKRGSAAELRRDPAIRKADLGV